MPALARRMSHFVVTVGRPASISTDVEEPRGPHRESLEVVLPLCDAQPAREAEARTARRGRRGHQAAGVAARAAARTVRSGLSRAGDAARGALARARRIRST